MVSRNQPADNDLRLALSGTEIYNTILQLHDARYVEWDEDPHFYGGGGVTFIGLKVSGRGLQVLGEWPRFEALVSPPTLATLVDRLAEYTEGDERSKMQRAAEVIRHAGVAGLRTLAIGAGSQLLRSTLGL
jgi:hypothetical protein